MRSLFLAMCLAAAPGVAAVTPPDAGIHVNPNGVNVNTMGATTVFLTFGGLVNQTAADAFWCGELVSAAPDIGQKCDPATIFGRLPARFDRSTSSGIGGFTDIMSIPTSVARRAYQAAADGARSSFFYVRRFVSTAGGPDEYVLVTCRMAGGGARVPFSLVDVRLAFAGDPPVLYVKPGSAPPPITAQITYNGTGRLTGRWEIVQPGEDLPEPRDLLTEASLPIEQRGAQRRYVSLERFNIFLAPTGKATLPGPNTSRLPTSVEGLYLVLLRVEASDDKEGDSNLATAGAGTGVVHSGAVAGFPLPVLRYFVGSGSAATTEMSTSGIALVQPPADAVLAPTTAIDLIWRDPAIAVLYRVDVRTVGGEAVLSAFVQPQIGVYRLPSWVKDKLPDGRLQWRVSALDPEGRVIRSSAWRAASFGS